MHFAFSIVIIAQNAENSISQTINAVKKISDDIIVLENGSRDNTAKIALVCGAKVINCVWLGYGDTKNIGHAEAKYDWILSLDADEVVDQELCNSIANLNFEQSYQIYSLKRYMMWNGKMLHFGKSIETKIRLFPKKFAKWDSSEVHEKLLFDTNSFQKKILAGKLLHYSYKDLEDGKKRNEKYAKADAIKKFNAGKKYLIWVPKIRGYIEFIKIYIFQLGFLDGKNGWEYASIKQYYKQMKYSCLKEMSCKY
jgi:glycosyltransferase involved in cell wall biosynthesis